METTQRLRKRQSSKTGIWLCLMLVWMAVIFSFSAQPADDSSRLSDGISYRLVAQAERLLHLELTENQRLDYAERIHYPIRKAAHMTEYAILAFLVWNLIHALAQTTAVAGADRAFFWKKDCVNRSRRAMFHALCAEAVVFLYAATDEFHQTFVPGRSGEFRDVCIDSTGALIALILIVVIYNRRRWGGSTDAEGHEKESD